MIHNLKYTQDIMKSWIRINCWTIGNFESSSLWQRYVQNNGIAIPSTFTKMINSFNESDKLVNASIVHYRDYVIEEIPQWNGFFLLTHKRKIFESEKELRLFTSVPIEKDTTGLNYLHKNDGMYVKIDLDILIEKIIVSPGTPSWILDLMQSVVQKYGHNFVIKKSEIDHSPPNS